MNFTRIDRVGIELEGAWAAHPAGAAYHSDGSVSVHGSGLPIVGEEVSAPMSDWETVSTWLRESYPAEHNATCGMHVHVSFKTKGDYARLMTPRFYTYFIARMTAWGKRANLPTSHLFWTRLNGFNSYCRKEFIPDAQANERTKNYRTATRYTQLNYCFRIHGTIEARLFPVFKQAAIAVSAVQELLNIYEDFLRETELTEHVEVIDVL